jgi:hypothetical protein
MLRLAFHLTTTQLFFTSTCYWNLRPQTINIVMTTNMQILRDLMNWVYCLLVPVSTQLNPRRN